VGTIRIVASVGGPNESLGNDQELAALGGLRLVPDCPDGIGVGPVAHQKACDVSLQRCRDGFERVLRVTPLATLQHRNVAHRHIQSIRDLVKRQLAIAFAILEYRFAETSAWVLS
jgi:hypothetical protein